MALKRREWSRQHEIGGTARQYRRKLGCSVALDATHGYDMTIGGFWVEGGPDGVPGSWDVVGTGEAKLLLPWNHGGPPFTRFDRRLLARPKPSAPAGARHIL